MELRFLGKGAAFYPLYGNTNAYFHKNGDLFLLDCGEGTYAELYRRGELEHTGEVYVLVTHLHADHVGSLGSLISYFFCVLKKKIHIIHPEVSIVKLLEFEGVGKESYLYENHFPYEADGVRAETVKVPHADNMNCYGYILTDEESCCYYSGDAAEIPKKVLSDFLEGKIDKIYQDTSSHETEKPSHCYYGTLEKEIPRPMRDRVYCMHLDGAYENTLLDLGFRVVEVETEEA